MQCIFFLIYPTQSVIVIFFVFSRMKVPLRKLSCGTRISKFISIYWRSLIVVLTPLLLLPIILENNTPVSNAHWRTWTKTKQNKFKPSSEIRNDILYAFPQQFRCLYVVILMTVFWCSEALPLRKCPKCFLLLLTIPLFASKIPESLWIDIRIFIFIFSTYIFVSNSHHVDAANCAVPIAGHIGKWPFRTFNNVMWHLTCDTRASLRLFLHIIRLSHCIFLVAVKSIVCTRYADGVGCTTRRRSLTTITVLSEATNMRSRSIFEANDNDNWWRFNWIVLNTMPNHQVQLLQICHALSSNGLNNQSIIFF